ncbi:uncharacterized protein LOC126912059 [Spodoptera frugiperda]|uniref:Uncharacterized protein LOC126912059 n=1 Tax=Spodoptera frugiperda TaxID=7108 RepID=A0A9R0F2S0_SPOFR|nr:uncharacterized protein LOC126912059 [Spodoptera frugiperda]
MSATMENILANQDQIIQAMEQQLRNFKKDSADRKTPANIKKRLQILDSYWGEFQENHAKLYEFEDRGYAYFSENMYDKARILYNEAQDIIQNYKPPTSAEKGSKSPSTSSIRTTDTRNQEAADERQQTNMLSVDSDKPNIKPIGTPSTSLFKKIVSRGNASKLEEMLRKQKSNFKALSRAIRNVDMESLSEKWEFEDVLKTIQVKWSTIDSLHWEIDCEMYSEDEEYEQEYSNHEQLYINIKKLVNSKMYSVSYRESFTPKIDIPTFSGNYQKWISFKDLFQEAVHNNKSIPNAQKMQLLKTKLKGEAERIIQHLNISSENYKVCWDILNHRYNNDRLIFTSHMNILLSIPTMQNQVDTQIKNMFDTINECMNSLKNLGIDVVAIGPMVVHLLTQKLDTQSLSEYTQSLDNPRALPVLTDFLKFLENKYTALESTRRKHYSSKSSSASSPSNNKDSEHQVNKKNQSKSNNFNKIDSNKPFLRSSTLKSCATRTQYCPLCKDDSHGLFYCKPFLELGSTEKRNTVQRFNLCENCLVDHKNKSCRSESKCRVCQGPHNTVLHDALQINAVSSKIDKSPSMSCEDNTHSNATHVSKEPVVEILLATALVRVQGINGEYHTMRALIDQGSQASLITENAAQILKLPRRACKGVIVGVSANQTNCKGVLSLVASSLYSNYTFQTEVVIMKKLINNLPNHSFSKPSWEYLQNIQLADTDFNVCRPIDLLLGAEVYAEIIMPGIIKENSSLPIAQQTQLGWILSGNVKSYQCNVIMNNIEDIQRFWSIEDVTDSNTDMSSEDHQCLQQYHSETVRREDGRYVVRLPLKPNINEKLGESKQRAVAQFYQLERKFARNKNISEDYKTFITEYIKLGHMRKCTQKRLPDCILPHLCVLRPDSTTTSLRVVFNASAKTSTGYSLNDLMYSGPNLQQDLFTLILKWRQYKYAFTADIEKMFRQILCNEKDLQYQKIVWRDSPSQVLREYELSTVTYGTKAAPFLAMMTLKRLAEDERSRYPTASAVLEQCFYMDDLLTGNHSIEEAKQLKADLINLLKSGGFNLRKWSSNNMDIQEAITNKEQAFEFKHQESTKTLGLRWHPQSDQFKFQMKIDTSSLTPSTKRSLLSDISKIFDPLGWLSPVSTKLKLLFQKVWSLNLQWDEAVPTHINEEWLKIKKELPHIEHINVPRWLQTPKNAIIELHGFCDSSEKAYACVIYGRIINLEEVEWQSPVVIVAGKSKLVPVNKSVSLPRLELCAAQLLSKLMKVVQNCLSNHTIRIYAISNERRVFLLGLCAPYLAVNTNQSI